MDIFRYLYVSNNKLEISKYSETIQNIKNINSRDNKKKDFCKKVKNYFLDEDNILHEKILVSENESVDDDKKIINEGKKTYYLFKIPEKLNILEYLNNLHKEDEHRGITSLRNYLYDNNIYIEGSSFLTDYTVKQCSSCAQKNKTKYKRKPAKQIITYFPKQRYIMDITELPVELK